MTTEATARANQDDAIETGAGLDADGGYTADATTNYLTAASSLKDADDKLDAQAKANADAISTNAANISSNDTDISNNASSISTNAGNISSNDTDISNNASSISTNAGNISSNDTDIANNAAAVTTEATARANQDDAIEAGAGLDADGGYTADATTNYLTAASSLKDADDKLDAQAKVNANAIAQEVTDRGTAVSGEATARANQDDAIEAGAGLNADGTYAQPSGTNYLDATTSLAGADAALDAQAKTNADGVSTNATNIAATDYFDQTGAVLAAGAGETWTEFQTATGTFSSGASAGTLSMAGGSITDGSGSISFGDENLSTTGTLGAGATTLGSTLDVTGAGEFDSSLGADGNLRVGASGTSMFQVNATSGTVTSLGDITTTGGMSGSTLLITGTALLQGTTTAGTMTVTNYLTLSNDPLLSSHAATKNYVDNHAGTLPQAYSYTSDVYEDMGADLTADGAGSVTITVTGANLSAGTYELHLDGGSYEVTETVSSSTEISFTLTRANVLTMTSRAGVVVPQLVIDGVASGLSVFVKL